jgi:hypothetical protein
LFIILNTNKRSITFILENVETSPNHLSEKYIAPTVEQQQAALLIEKKARAAIAKRQAANLRDVKCVLKIFMYALSDNTYVRLN